MNISNSARIIIIYIITPISLMVILNKKLKES
jgi:hypothetical protein